MIGFYARVSSVQQKTDRQLTDVTGMKVFEDRCSGAIPFQERPAGKRVIDTLLKGNLEELVVHSLDRLGRNLLDILNTIELFTEHGVSISVRQQGLRTLNDNGKPNPTSKLIISILGVVAEMERAQIRERQLEGIAIAKAKGMYVGRRAGSVETRERFLQKPRNQKILQYLRDGLKGTEIQKLMDCSPNTISKIKRLASHDLQLV